MSLMGIEGLKVWEDGNGPESVGFVGFGVVYGRWGRREDYGKRLHGLRARARVCDNIIT